MKCLAELSEAVVKWRELNSLIENSSTHGHGARGSEGRGVRVP